MRRASPKWPQVARTWPIFYISSQGLWQSRSMGPRTLESVVNLLSHCASEVAFENLTVRPKAIISNAWTSHAICETELFCNISSPHSFYIFCHYFSVKSLLAPLAAPDAKPRRAMALSRPLVASSAKSSVGSVSSSVAKAKRRRSPPGNVDATGPAESRSHGVTESKLSSCCVGWCCVGWCVGCPVVSSMLVLLVLSMLVFPHLKCQPQSIR